MPSVWSYMGYSRTSWARFYAQWSEIEWAEYCAQGSEWSVEDWREWFEYYNPREWSYWVVSKPIRYVVLTGKGFVRIVKARL